LIAATEPECRSSIAREKQGIEVSDKNIEGVTIAFGSIDVHGTITGLEGGSATVELIPVVFCP
jgi:hypothetical protein